MIELDEKNELIDNLNINLNDFKIRIYKITKYD